ncbi:MAG TPA: alcohol acetyltransferase [Ruminococcaceae bacterium]|nr:alcohol acetyltransferase [Oscillospiraceae bacterium]
MSKWYKLDNAAKLFPPVTGKSYSSVFRLSAVLYKPVDKKILQKAVDHIFNRFPMMFLRMRKGVFWNYFDTNHEKFVVEEERQCPCAEINPEKNNGYLLKILYFGNRIAIEMFHSLTDGSGAAEFLKTLLFYYFRFLGEDIEDEGKLLLTEDGVSADETEDSFSKYYEPEDKTVKPAREPRAFRVRGTPFEACKNNVTTGVVSASGLSKLAKTQNATITSYLASLLIYSISMEQQRCAAFSEPVVVAIPVNLRKIFPSMTLRNFFAVANVGTAVSRAASLEDIIPEITRQLKIKTEKPALQTFMSENVSLERKLWSRLVPLSIKKPFIMIGTDVKGESRKSASLSNLGILSAAPGFISRVKYMEANLYPTPKSPINCAVCSLGDRLTISFSRTIIESEIIRRFFSHLAQSLEVEVYSNDWGRSM